MIAHILDNPIWNALTSLDENKNIGVGFVKYFDSSMAPFIGAKAWDDASQRILSKEVPPDRNWFLLIAEPVKFIDDFEIVFTIPLYQLTCANLHRDFQQKENIEIVPLNTEHVEEMIALTALTKPGPFLQRTIEFGNYHGIFQEGKLVAMGGERLHVEGFTEISAICTHPEFQGSGFGAHITHFLASMVIQRGSIPFLHARYDNHTAIALYKKLGFEIREEMQFYIFRKKQQ